MAESKLARRQPFTPKKGKRECNEEEDKISQLPDELLLFILSFLTMKEAARTCVFSHRWQKVWTFIPCLKFDDVHDFVWMLIDADLEVGRFDCKDIAWDVDDEGRILYINWVNGVLDSYQGTSIGKFKVQYDLNENYKDGIDRWVKFAFEKNVKQLVMDFRRSKKACYDLGKQVEENYTFPLVVVANISTLRHLVGYADYSFLRDLVLKRVNVSEDVIECFLSCCPCLAKVTLVDSDSLVHLKVVDGLSSLCLKHLTVRCCRNLKSLLVSATNLLSFKYSGARIDIVYGNLPNLVVLHLGSSYGKYSHNMTSNLSLLLPSIAYQLVTLKLVLPRKETMISHKFPLLRHLKNLTVRMIDNNNAVNVPRFASLIEASPCLHTFRLEVFPPFGCRHSLSSTPMAIDQSHPHQCLKVAEVIGSEGSMMEIDFLTYLIANAVALEKIIVDPLLHGFRACIMFTEEYQRKIKNAVVMAVMFKGISYVGDKLVLRNCDEDLVRKTTEITVNDEDLVRKTTEIAVNDGGELERARNLAKTAVSELSDSYFFNN